LKVEHVEDKKITGLMFAYSYLCMRKLWFYSQGIQMEQNSEDVKIGKLLDENSYKKEDKHILINDCVNIDYLKDGIVYEIKKSKAEKEMSVAQIKYYLYHLWKSGVASPIGILKIPSIKYQEEISLLQEDIEEIENQLIKIREIILKKCPPSLKEIKACKKCAYYEFCYI